MPTVDDDTLRIEIRSLLASGLATEVFPRADTHEDVLRITSQLQAAGDLESKLRIGGFTAYPVAHNDISQVCETCMYYKVHRKYCELPELNVPVDPDWSCRLWRI